MAMTPLKEDNMEYWIVIFWTVLLIYLIWPDND